MIAIDFQAGAHGNFLEFVCNVMAGVHVGNNSPFNAQGASHAKTYLAPPIFIANHYCFSAIALPAPKVVSVQITRHDLLPLSQISLLRAGDYGLDNDCLELDTYHKLNNVHYSWVLDILISSFFQDQISHSYQAVKDPSWPCDVHTLSDFSRLPQHIQDECINVHKLDLKELSAAHPHCPRSVLREFFEIGFADPELNGFLTLQREKMIYESDVDVYKFDFADFYNTERFVHQLKEIALWAGLDYNNHATVISLHKEFMQKQPYHDSKQRCDELVQHMIVDHRLKPKVTMIEEAYINARLVELGHERRY